MKRIIILVKNNFINDRRVFNTAVSLQNHGYNTRIIAVSSYRKMKYYDDPLKVKRIPSFSSVYSKPRANIQTIRTNKKTKDYIQKIKQNKFRKAIISILNSFFYNIGSYFYSIFSKPNYVWANDLNTLFVAYLISITCGSKLIYDSHEIFIEGNSFESLTTIQKSFLKKVERAIIRKTDAVIVTTDLRAEYLKKQYSLSKVWTIMNCHKLVKLNTSDLLRAEFSIPDSSIIFLYQGLIHRKRGIFALVDVISEVKDAVLILMGDGANKQELFNYIEDKELNNQIFIKDAVPMNSLIQYTASADVGFQLLANTGFNHYSTISNKVFEYIMAEIPIIASDFPELRKLVIENNIGLVVDPENISEIIKTIQKMINNKQNYLGYKQNLHRIRTEYTWENQETKIIELLSGITK